MAPENMPKKNRGAMRAAAVTPTRKAESVMSKTNQPTATCSIPVLKEQNRVEAQNNLKSRYRKEEA